MELIPVKYCVTIEIRNSKLNLVIIKPPRLLSNLGGSLHPIGRLVGGLSFHLFIYVQLNFILKFIYVAAQTFIK